METLQWIKSKGIDSLNYELGISVKKYDEGLIVLNYNQIDSPKFHPVVKECRGLIIDSEFNVVSRSFDRFFNFGEDNHIEDKVDIDWSKVVCHEKVDGSLIKIYKWNDAWHISTRGTAFGETGVNGFNITFKELVLKALDCSENEFQARCEMFLDPENTYICELTSTENRVVTRYQGSTLWYLATRNNISGEFVPHTTMVYGVGIKDIKSFKFNTVEDCISTAKSLKDLQEGYVLYQDGEPIYKVKSPAYVAVHHLRGNDGLNPKRIMQLVLMNEQDEYLKYFPEDSEFFSPYTQAFTSLLVDIAYQWVINKDVEDQKEFAIRVKDLVFSAIMFQAKKQDKCPVNVFNESKESYKLKVLEGYVNAT